MDPDQWLEQNTFYCLPYQTRITPAQCEINRERDNQPGTPTQAPTGITACNGCDWEKMQKPDVGGQRSEIRKEKIEEIKKELKTRLERKKQARENKILQPAPRYDEIYHKGVAALENINNTGVSMAKKPMIHCPECGRDMLLHCRGLCGTCYYRLKRKGVLDEKYPSKRREPVPENPAPKELPEDLNKKTDDREFHEQVLGKKVIDAVFEFAKNTNIVVSKYQVRFDGIPFKSDITFRERSE